MVLLINGRRFILARPIFVKILEPKITVDEGSELTLQVECAGCPEPEISW